MPAAMNAIASSPRNQIPRMWKGMKVISNAPVGSGVDLRSPPLCNFQAVHAGLRDASPSARKSLSEGFRVDAPIHGPGRQKDTDPQVPTDAAVEVTAAQPCHSSSRGG